jgi:cyclopropane-fatty-acyl-phospholipid synthase
MEAVITSERTFQNSLNLLQEILGSRGPTDFAVRLWDGTEWKPARSQKPRWTLILKHPGALRRMFLPINQLSLGEAYIYDDFDIEGDMEECFYLAYSLLEIDWSLWEKMRFAYYLNGLPGPEAKVSRNRRARLRGSAHSKRRDAEAIRYHYDVSNDFYKLWLDERMVYSCAYFADPQVDLDTAQERKLDYICRKLRLEPGEKLLDIGCGWGGLLMHAAQHYGVEAHGITLSVAQAEMARERIREAGLEKRCRVDVCDYRDLKRPGTYDKLVSVGMFEHVGAKKLPEYFERAWNLLRPRGVFLNHGIADNPHLPPSPGPSFLQHYVFPDGDLLPVTDTLRIAELTGFEIRDLENLREHYALTLRQWVKRLESASTEAKRLTDETTYRIWRLYMAASAHSFSAGRVNVYQTLMVKPDDGDSGLPLTREDWYR